jgi:hypothetical protein
MENWEFLLQKQGDKSWLPLESPTVEILEGHYRLASRTKLANALIGIQLSYIPSAGLQTPSRQKFSKRIDSKGLLIVMPYTHFTAGTWQIECINLEPQEAQKSKTRSVTVFLEVQPMSADSASDWQLNIPQLDASIDTPSDLQEPSSMLSDEHGISSPEPKNIDEIAALPLNLIALHQTQYLVSESQSPILSGISYLPGKLEVILRSPQDLEILMHTRFSLETTKTSNTPIEFSFELQIPARASQVAIGEVRLHPSPGISLPDSQTHIYHQAIAIAFQSQNILAEVARELTDAARLQSVKKLFDPGSDAIAAKSSDPENTKPQPPTPNPSARSPQLPQLTKISPLPKIKSASGRGDRDLDSSESQQEQFSAEERVESVAEVEMQNGLEAFTEHVPTELPSVPEAEIKPDVIVKSLDKDDSLLDKLRSLSKDSIAESLLSQQVSELIEAEVGKLESEIERSLDLEDLGDEFEKMLLNDELLTSQDRDRESETERTSEPAVDRLASEARVNSELLEDVIPEHLSDRKNERNEQEDRPHYSEQEIAASEALQEVLAAREIINSSTDPEQQSLPTLAANEPIPTPILEIPEEEAIAGFPLPVLIKLPSVRSKLFVKLWVKDCQTRNIIDGPRWLVDFQWGNDPNYLTLSMPITLPLGVMAVMFEAITIEMQTQRESRKTSILRSVAPPNLSLDDDLDFDPPGN